MTLIKNFMIFISFLCLFISSLVAAADEDRFAKIEIQTVKVTDGIFMLIGSGGNIGVSAGDDGVFMIDDQFAPLTTKIKAAIAKVSDKPIRFLINTHWHYDHTGGNENLGKDGVVIAAHDNVYHRMSKDAYMKAFKSSVPAAPEIARPVFTYNDTVTFRLNNEEIHVFHYKNAHTDGDSIVHFKTSNVIHTGDVWFNGVYPFIDAESGGSVEGVIMAVKKIISLADDKTKIMPGHGQLSDKKGITSYLEFLQTLRDRMKKLIDAGKTLDEIKAQKPFADYDESYGKGFLSPEKFIEVLYTAMTS